MRCDELPKLIDGSNAVQIALALRVAPREQAMSAKYDPIAVRVFGHRLLQHQAQFKSRSLPGQPYHVASESLVELSHFLFAVGACCQRYGPIGMQVVHVRKGKKAVQ